MNTEKIAFLYPTWIRPGMRADCMSLPDIGYYVDKLPSTMQFCLTFGIIVKADSSYRLQIDVTFNGKSILSQDKDPVTIALEKRAVTKSDNYVAIETLHIQGVSIENEGCHDITINLLKSESSDDEHKLIDTDRCSFFVSRAWIS